MYYKQLAPLKLRPYGAIQICLLLLLLLLLYLRTTIWRCCVVSAILESSTDVATYLLTFLHRSVELDAFSGLERSSGEIGQSLCMTTAHYRTTETALWLRSLIFGRRVSCVLDPFPPPPPRVLSLIHI